MNREFVGHRVMDIEFECNSVNSPRKERDHRNSVLYILSLKVLFGVLSAVCTLIWCRLPLFLGSVERMLQRLRVISAQFSTEMLTDFMASSKTLSSDGAPTSIDSEPVLHRNGSGGSVRLHKSRTTNDLDIVR